MIFNKKNFFLVILLLLIFLLSIFVWPVYKNLSFKSQVIFLDIGQGDATLFKLPNRQIILIDGGPDNLILRRLGEELPFYIKKIDLIFVSHWHDDHVVGLIEVMRRFQIGAILYAADLTISHVGEILLEEARAQNIKIITVKNQGRLDFGDNCQFSFLNPLALNIKDNDNNSLIIKLNCNENKFLLAGDNEKAVEDALIKFNLDLKVDIFKASHHGSKTSNQKIFLEQVNPKFLLISAGFDNRFKHPSPEILKNAIELGINIWRTDLQGTARFMLK